MHGLDVLLWGIIALLCIAGIGCIALAISIVREVSALRRSIRSRSWPSKGDC